MKNEKVFLSLGMDGVSDEQIDRDLAEMMDLYTEKYGYDVEFVDNFACFKPEGNNQKAWYLGEAIKKLGDCDTIIMMYNWQHYRGCKVELEFARQYGLNILEVDLNTKKKVFEIRLMK